MAEPLSQRPRRDVHAGDALTWLRAHAPLARCSVITSLPDWSELPTLTLAAWKTWFEEAAFAVISAVPADGIAVFFQSDIRSDGAWIDKGHLVTRAAERAGMVTWFHHIVCRKPPGTAGAGRASYAHLLGFGAHPPRVVFPTADVMPDGGARPGTKAMGTKACLAALEIIARATPTRTIVDPFCGFGTVLAVANARGFDAVGVDLSVRMCRKARALVYDHTRQAVFWPAPDRRSTTPEGQPPPAATDPTEAT
ncbi:MAG TPA: SAM-dependent methyltransferase [Polyangia bacterium]